MRKFYIRLSVFIGITGILLLLIEAGFRLKPNVFKDKYDGLNAKAGNVEVLLMGHSHIEDGINPDLLSFESFNMGFGYENVYYDKYLLRHFIDRMPSLKCVVLSGSCFHLFNELPDLYDMRGEDLFNTIKYHLYCNLDSVKTDRIPRFAPEYNLEILNNPPKAYYETAKYYLSSFKTGIGQYGPFYRNGYVPINDSCSEEFLNRDGIRYSSIHFGKKDYPFAETVNYRIYESMADICRQHNIKFVITLFPAWHTFWENALNNQYEVTSLLFNQLAAKYENCIFLDYSHDSTFTAEDFRDATHLNCHGAEKMTEKLELAMTSIM